MVSIAVDLDWLGIWIVQVVIESLGAEDQTAMTTVIQVHEDPLESCPVDLPGGLLEKAASFWTASRMSPVTASDLAYVSERAQETAIWNLLHVLMFFRSRFRTLHLGELGVGLH